MTIDISRRYRVPFVNSPFYNSLKKDFYNPEFSSYADSLNENGYAIIDLEIDSEIIDKANEDIQDQIDKNTIKTNSKAYHYNSSPRIVEAWKFSESIKKIVKNNKLINTLRYLMEQVKM